MPTKTRPPVNEPIVRPRVSQAELFCKFEHLDRHRAAVALATRLLRILSAVPPETAEIAMEIASTATRMRNGSPATAGLSSIHPLSDAQVEPR